MSPKLSDEEIEKLDPKSQKAKELMEQYKEETEKYAIWRGVITEGFKRWLKGEKIYTRDKERISFYVSDEAKTEWQEFINENKDDYPSFSKLIRESVNTFIEDTKIQADDFSKINRNTISNISHALKEPLTSIKGFAQAILDGTVKDEEAQVKAASIIEDESKRMMRLVDDLLELSKLEAGQIAMELEPVDVKELLEHCHDIALIRAEESELELTLDIQSTASVNGDIDRLEQVINNLLDNG